MQHSVNNTLGTITKMLLVSLSPLQPFLDSPGLTHIFCLNDALKVLANDGKPHVVDLFSKHLVQINKGLLWADRGWKNASHYYQSLQKQGLGQWLGALTEFQYYYNKALVYYRHSTSKSLFYFGAALHLIQDMCVPHHAVGKIFNGHQEFEQWVENNYHMFITNSGGIYLPGAHPTQWLEYNAGISAGYYPLICSDNGGDEEQYRLAARELIPLTIRTSAGFLSYFHRQSVGQEGSGLSAK